MMTEVKQKIDRLLNLMTQSEESYEQHYPEFDKEMKTFISLLRKEDKHDQ